MAIIATLLCIGRVACAEDAALPTSTAAMCDEFASRINKLVTANNIVASIFTVAEYESAVFAKYPPATFEQGRFQSEAYHVSFVSPYDGWKSLSAKEVNLPAWLPSTGFDLILALQGTSEDEKLLLLTFDIGKINRMLSDKTMGSEEESRNVYRADGRYHGRREGESIRENR